MTGAHDDDVGRRDGRNTLSRRYDAFCDGVTGLLFLAGAVAMFAMVVTRYGFAWSDPSVEIIVSYSMIWGTFVGVSAGMRYGINIRFTLLEHALGDTGKKAVQTVALSLTFLIAVGLAASGKALVAETMMFNEVMPTSLRWPVWPFHVSILAGGAMLALQALRSIVALWGPGAHASSDATDAGAI
jgi:TRAP-type C4-dicarboxylate transport system permease small subunit